MKNQHLTRRSLLRAGGLTLALPAFASIPNSPFLQTVRAQPPVGKEVAAPKRFCCIFFPNGVSLPPVGHPAHNDWHWFPHQVGPDYLLTKTLEPLQKHRDFFSILSGLSNPPMRSSIAHITADTFLTCADSSRGYKNSISLDQLIAHEIGDQTRFASLSLSSDGGVGTPGRTQTLSFTAAGRPIPSLSKPRAIFNRMFGIGEQSTEQQRRQFGRDRSILDHLRTETTTLHRNLSARDRQRLEEYLTSVREIEYRLERSDRWLDGQRPQVDEDDFDLALTPRDSAKDYIRVILDLIYVAFLTDSTRSIAYQITSEDAKGIGDNFPKSIGLSGHHALSHSTDDETGYENWARYDRFLASQLAYLLERLQATEDPFQSGTLLDNTIVYYGCSTSQTHKAVNYPIILAGGKSMGFRHGQHRHFDESRYRISDLYVTFLQQLGIEVDRFADSTRTLGDLLSVS